MCNKNTSKSKESHKDISRTYKFEETILAIVF